MGSSSRPDNFSPDFTVDEATNYFNEYMEKWRQKLGLEDFYLVGHSLGAYLSGIYASKYPTRIRKLILLSPIGIKWREDHELTDDFIIEDVSHTHPGGIGLKERFGMWISSKRITPFQIGRTICYCIMRKYMHGYVERRMSEPSISNRAIQHEYLL